MAIHIISTLVENKPGVLYKVSNMFRARNYNIESISVGPTEQRDISRMTITMEGDDATAEQTVRQLAKIIDVVKVSTLTPEETVYRELALVKLFAEDSKKRSDIVTYADIFRGRIVDVSPETLTIEITGSPDKIDAFIRLTSHYRIKELARTGLTALSRG